MRFEIPSGSLLLMNETLNSVKNIQTNPKNFLFWALNLQFVAFHRINNKIQAYVNIHCLKDLTSAELGDEPCLSGLSVATNAI